MDERLRNLRALMCNGQNNPIDEWDFPNRKGSPSLTLAEQLIKARKRADER